MAKESVDLSKPITMKLLTKYIPTSLCRAYRNSSADTLCVPSVHLSKPFGESDHLRVSTVFTLFGDFAYLIEHIPRRLRLYLYYKEMRVGGLHYQPSLY